MSLVDDATIQLETKRRFRILERVLQGMAAGHVFVEFESPAVVEIAMGGPGRRVDLGEPDQQGFYSPAVWVSGPPLDEEGAEESTMETSPTEGLVPSPS